MTKQLNISFFENYSNITAIREATLTIEQFYKSLSDYIIKTKTQNYKNLSIEDIKAKKILGIVPVLFDNKRRHADSMSISKRCMITIDIDSFEGTLDELKTEIHNRFSELCYITYTTGKSSEEKPRVRLILFLKNDFSVTTKQEHDLYKKKIQGFCKKYFGDFIIKRDKKEDGKGNYITFARTIYDDKFEIDDASTQANRLMLLPFFYDSEPLLHMNEGELVDLDSIIIEEEKEKVKTFANKQSRASVSDLSEEDDRNVAELAKLLSNINPSELSYQERLNVGYVIKYEYQGSDEGKEMFANWCLLDSTRTSSTEVIINEAYASYKSMPEHDLITTRRYYVYSLIRRIANAKRKELDIEVSYYPIPKHLFSDITIKKDGSLEVKSTQKNFDFMLEYYNVDIFFNVITKQEDATFKINSSYDILGLICTLLEINAFKDKRTCRDVYLPIFYQSRFKNPFSDLIKATKWDGVDRMQELCNTITLACEEEDYIKKLDFLDEDEKGLIVERKWLAIKMKHVYVKAWLKQMMYMHMNTDLNKKTPRYILCFKGKEKIGKTFWTRTLLPKELPSHIYASDSMTIDTKTDTDLLKVLGVMICELGELIETFRQMGADRFKQFLSRKEDTLNYKYALRTIKVPRLTSFIATLNDMYFLNNRDEHTRFLAMHVSKMNGYHNIDMRQLYAQVYENEDWQNFELTSEEEKIQILLNKEESVTTDEMQELVAQYFLDAEASKNTKVNRTFYSCVQILNIVGYRDANVKNSANRLAKLLKRMGYYRTSSDKKFLIVQK